MSFRELRDQALKKKLLQKMDVWRKGEETRYPSQEIVGLIPNLPASPQEDPAPPSFSDDGNPYAPPEAERSISHGPPGGLYLPYLRPTHFPLLILLLAGAAGLGYFATQLSDPPTRAMIFAFAGVLFLGASLFFILYLRRAWDMMDMLGAPMHGTKAVIIFLIPLFNALWSFIAIYGWAKLWNYNCKYHPGLSAARSVWKFSFLLFCIGFLMTQVIVLLLAISKEIPNDLENPRHQFALATFAVSTLLTLTTWYQLCRSVNFLARKKF